MELGRLAPVQNLISMVADKDTREYVMEQDPEPALQSSRAESPGRLQRTSSGKMQRYRKAMGVPVYYQ